jgi:hypothetical protein
MLIEPSIAVIAARSSANPYASLYGDASEKTLLLPFPQS